MPHPIRTFWRQLAPEDKKLIAITGIVCALILLVSAAGLAIYLNAKSDEEPPPAGTHQTTASSATDSTFPDLPPPPPPADDSSAAPHLPEHASEALANNEASAPPAPPEGADTFDAASHRQLMILDAQEYNFTGALAHGERCKWQYANDPDFLREYAHALLMAGHPARAVPYLQRALSPDSSVAVAWDLVFALLRSEQAQAALDLAQAMQARAPRSDSLLAAQAAVLAEWPDTTRRKEALPLFQSLVKRFPGSAEGRYQFARYLMRAGNYGSAYKEAAAAVHLQSGVPRYHARLGMAAFGLRRDTEAEREYKTALRLNPYDYNTHYNLGELYASQANETFSVQRARTKRAQALQSYLAALDQDSTLAQAHYRVGVLLVGNQEYSEAIRHLTLALSKLPDGVPCLLQLATAYQQLGDTARALDYWNAALVKDPFNKIAAGAVAQIKQEQAAQESPSSKEPE